MKGRIKVSLLGTIHCMYAEFYVVGLIEGDNTGQPGKYLQAHVATGGMEDKLGVWVFFETTSRKTSISYLEFFFSFFKAHISIYFAFPLITPRAWVLLSVCVQRKK